MPGPAISTERLWELLSDKLRSFLVRRVSDHQAAEDLLQETFVRIHKGLNDFDDEQRLHAWVFQIARNLVIDHRRAGERAASVGHEFEEHPAAALVEADDEANLNDVVRDWLPPMIEQLPERYRDAVRLFELEGLPQQEIAERLGLSLSGAKSRVQRGREQLKSLLFDCCSFERDRRGNVIGFTRNGPSACGACEAD